MKYILDKVDRTLGMASIRISNDDNTSVRRVSIVPGSWDNAGNWIATDISTIPQEVRGDVIALWTASVITAYRNAFPYVPPAPSTAAELARAERGSNAEASALRARVLTATDAQINSFVDANVTDMPSARAMFKRILKIIAADMRED